MAKQPGKRGPKKGAPNAGRPRIEIDLAEVEKLAAIDCTDEEISAVMGISRETFSARKQQKGSGIKEAIAEGKSRGCASLRRQMFRQAMDGDRTMLIWLSKNRLNYTDRLKSEQTTTIEVVDHRAKLLEKLNTISERRKELAAGAAGDDAVH